jgi:hypothetical protein
LPVKEEGGIQVMLIAIIIKSLDEENREVGSRHQ